MWNLGKFEFSERYYDKLGEFFLFGDYGGYSLTTISVHKIHQLRIKIINDYY